ncbi:MAG TPA: hypothetical protein VHQ47_17660 [Phycisphaerae bacterium]|nr:hypothetical protein [Phycisphaerae bacterium]
MITNACIVSLQRRTGASAGGDPLFASATIIAADDLRVFKGGVSARSAASGGLSIRFALGATIDDASVVVFVEKQALADMSLDDPGLLDRITVVVDDDDPAGQAWQILGIAEQVLGDLSHFELFVKPV